MMTRRMIKRFFLLNQLSLVAFVSVFLSAALFLVFRLFCYLTKLALKSQPHAHDNEATAARLAVLSCLAVGQQ